MLHAAQGAAVTRPATDEPGSRAMATLGRALPYLLSWGVLAALMIVGMNRLPLTLYTPMDGEWAKWNVEAILHFGKVFDLSPYSMLAGMGSMYFPNLPWLNPGALALALPLEDNAKNIVSYAVYAAELAISIILLARALGFSWLIATAAAQLHLYLLFPPFSDVFRIYDWYSLAPYYAHLISVLNAAAALLLACGRARDWRGNVALCVGILILFISGLLSAPFTFIFAIPAYAAILAVVILARRPPRAEWAWKAAALLACLIFFFATGLCMQNRGAWLHIAALAGRRGRHARRRHPGRRLRLHRLYRVCAPLCLRLSGRNARTRERPLQPFRDLVELGVHEHLHGRSLLRAVPPDQSRHARGCGSAQAPANGKHAGKRRRLRRYCRDRLRAARPSLRHRSLSRRAADQGRRRFRRCAPGHRNHSRLLEQENLAPTDHRAVDFSDPGLRPFVHRLSRGRSDRVRRHAAQLSARPRIDRGGKAVSRLHDDDLAGQGRSDLAGLARGHQRQHALYQRRGIFSHPLRRDLR